jgi:hypothetical protein
MSCRLTLVPRSFLDGVCTLAEAASVTSQADNTTEGQDHMDMWGSHKSYDGADTNML